MIPRVSHVSPKKFTDTVLNSKSKTHIISTFSVRRGCNPHRSLVFEGFFWLQMEVNFFFSKRGGLDVGNYSLLMRAMVSELKKYEKHRRFISNWIMSPKVSR